LDKSEPINIINNIATSCILQSENICTMSKTIENNQDYQKSIIINTNPTRALEALTLNIDKWWGGIDNPPQKVGDVFTVSWGEPWYQFKITEFIPSEIITWECIDANQIIGGLEGVEKEWVGTKLSWEIQNIEPNNVQVSVTHQGLIPQFICYDVCSSAWDGFITEGLKNYLEAMDE